MQPMGYGATVLGASGYAGGELVRLLAGHPALSLLAAGAHSTAGQSLESAVPVLLGSGATKLCTLEQAAQTPADVCFSCLPEGALAELLGSIQAGVVVDLSGDNRADESWVYGLSEFARDRLAGAERIANPGCYPTATLLALTPFLQQGWIGGPVVVDAMSGTSGAGRKSEDRLLFSTIHSSASAYSTTEHRHVPEIERGLTTFGGRSSIVSFTPHLIPVARGLLVTARAPLANALDTEGALGVLDVAYASEPFVHVMDQWPATKDVSGTNRAHLSVRVDERAGFLIASAAIDNLGKGAAGQAIQNANIALGVQEAAGLEAMALWP